MIESLNSPHIARVKALIGARGVKERKHRNQFVAEGAQCINEALITVTGPTIDTLYLTQSGRSRLEHTPDENIVIEVSDEVMKEMSQTVTPQGILGICSKPNFGLTEISLTGRSKLIYLFEMSDPGNAGTILRSADAMGMDAVLISPGSVDMFSPKVVRSTAGSLWHIPVVEGVSIAEVFQQLPSLQLFALSPNAPLRLDELTIKGDCLAIFGNEARGLASSKNIPAIIEVKIPMGGRAESLNLSASASIVMYHLSNIPT